MDGWWDCDDLTSLLRLLSRAIHRIDPMRNVLARSVGRSTDVVRSLRRQDGIRDRANVAAHYDLGNDLFELFLDESMTYSAGIFAGPDDSMLDASTTKFDRLCQRLELGPTDRLLEIGTGWGAFAIHAARTYGCRVTTTTISAEQYEHARERVSEAGLDHQIDVRSDDYRDLTGTYDKLASIEMIEAIDWRDLDTFFLTCSRLLEPDGLMALQTIVIDGSRWERAKNTRDFVKAHIFPGGCLPSVDSIGRALSRGGDLSMMWLDDCGLHYAETLRRWRTRFDRHRSDLDRLGYDERFARKWEFYLCYCEAGFEERDVSVIQAVLARPGYRPAEPWAAPDSAGSRSTSTGRRPSSADADAHADADADGTRVSRAR